MSIYIRFYQQPYKQLSRNTISEVLHLADANGLDWSLDNSVTNEDILVLLYPDRTNAVNPRKEPDYSYIHKELAKPDVNLMMLWSEYCSTCNAEGNIPYMYSQFCEKYRQWARVTKAAMCMPMNTSAVSPGY